MKLLGYLIILRPHQWLKNLILFFPPFLSGAILNPGMFAKGILPFCAFSLVSSVAYITNDLRDVEQDQKHPLKSKRPLASGMVAKSSAVLLALLVLVVASLLGLNISTSFLLFMAVYLLLTTLYSFVLKDWPIIDVFCIAIGFVLRLYAGGEAFGVQISSWLFLTVFLLAFFLSVGKRFSESLTLGEGAGRHRRALDRYPDGFFDVVMSISGAAVLVAYSLYVVNRPFLIFTVPLCMFGLLRYLFCIKSGNSGDPTTALFRDVPLLATSAVWVVMVAWGIYQ